MVDPNPKSNIYELSAWPGAGNLVLEGSTGFYRKFRDVFALDERFPYGIEDDELPGFENGVGYLSAPTVLVRETVWESSNGDALVAFSASVKRVFCPIPAIQHAANNAKISDRHYAHTQGVPSAVWTIAHGLGKFPAVTVTDSAGSAVHGDIEYLDANTVRLTFRSAFGGLAYLN